MREAQLWRGGSPERGGHRRQSAALRVRPRGEEQAQVHGPVHVRPGRRHQPGHAVEGGGPERADGQQAALRLRDAARGGEGRRGGERDGGGPGAGTRARTASSGSQGRDFLLEKKWPYLT